MTKIKFKHGNQYKIIFIFFKSSTKWFENCPVRATKLVNLSLFFSYKCLKELFKLNVAFFLDI